MATIVIVMYGLVPFLNEELVPEMNPGIRLIYGSLHRFGWTVAVSWIIFACVNGYAGNKLIKQSIIISIDELSSLYILNRVYKHIFVVEGFHAS